MKMYGKEGYTNKTVNNMETRFFAVKVRYIGPTNFDGSKVSLSLKGFRKVLDYECGDRSALQTAIKYLQSVGADVRGSASLNSETDIVLCNKYPEGK